MKYYLQRHWSRWSTTYKDIEVDEVLLTKKYIEKQEICKVYLGNLNLLKTLLFLQDKMMELPNGNSPEDLKENSEVPEPPAKMKKKHHRRARKNWKRNLSEPAANVDSKPDLNKKKVYASQPVFLRPTKDPLLNAPRNFTQFIIDDHENSNLFIDFSVDHVSADDRGGNCTTTGNDHQAQSKSENDNDTNEAEALEPRVSQDEDAFWAEYYDRDFQSVYENAHQEAIASWDRDKLCKEIAMLERRQKELVSILARLDPDVYLQRLQAELLVMQEEHKALQEERERLNPVLPDSSTHVAKSSDQEENCDPEGEQHWHLENLVHVETSIPLLHTTLCQYKIELYFVKFRKIQMKDTVII